MPGNLGLRGGGESCHQLANTKLLLRCDQGETTQSDRVSERREDSGCLVHLVNMCFCAYAFIDMQRCGAGAAFSCCMSINAYSTYNVFIEPRVRKQGRSRLGETAAPG